jgi:murein DD-endopeptidase MepM/ murein hydrolase activator NlpD
MQRSATRSNGRGKGLSALRWLLLITFVSAVFLLGAFVSFSAAQVTAVVGPSAPVLVADEWTTASLDVSAAPAAAIAVTVPALPEPPPLEVFEGEIEPGMALGRALEGHGIPATEINAITRAMKPHFDFRRARPGHRYRLERDLDGSLVTFEYQTSSTEGYRLRATDEGYEVQREEATLVPHRALIAGLVGTTLYQAIVSLGEQGQLARDFANVFAWDIDFQRSVQPGDAFQIVYERLFRVDLDGVETYERPGRILAARYTGAAGEHTAVYFESSTGRGGYFRPDGGSVEGEFLMAPLNGRITSNFTNARHHPILKITRPHEGIDYAAPQGTPVWSVSDGKVIHVGGAGSFGRLVKVQHRNGYVSYYSHLSRYANELAVGDRVEQKQIIGYVGSSGLATGPHVCFRVKKDGQYVNPARLRAGDVRQSIPSSQLPAFHVTSARLLDELDGRRQLADAE